MQFRYKFMGVGTILTIIVLFLSDPDGGLVQNLPFGSGTVSLMINLLLSVLYIGMLHVGIKGLSDYVDLESVYKRAMLTQEGPGLIFIGMGLLSIAIAVAILAATK